MNDGVVNLGRQLWKVLDLLGVGMDARYKVRLAAHRLRLHDDDLVRAFDHIRELMSDNGDLLDYAESVLKKHN